MELTLYPDEACRKLNTTKSEELSEQQKRQAGECQRNAGKTSTDSRGRYSFANPQPGWYSLTFSWKSDRKADLPFASGPLRHFLMQHHEGCLATYVETTATPSSSYISVCSDIRFTGNENVVKDFKFPW
ncbi:MAG: carboxypeptidase regulatory-like domain-containing protein [Acidobacteria bacterium]|nr:carboxypeptidase regulatory-like domain-containing protein [Acidobacteriota bacterium]